MYEVEKQIEDSKNEEVICIWEEDIMNTEKEIQSSEKEMKKVRDKKIKHALKIHGEGRVFTKSCLIKRGETQKSKTAENISRTPKTVSVTSNRDSHRMGEKQTSENSKAPTGAQTLEIVKILRQMYKIQSMTQVPTQMGKVETVVKMEMRIGE